MQQSKNCIQCGNLFFKNPNISQKEWKLKTRFCSRICYRNNCKDKSLKHLNKYQFKKDFKPWNKGLTKETTPIIQKISEKYWQGDNNPMKKLSAREKSSQSHLGKNMDEVHPNWKGDKVGYGALHDWVRSRRGKPTTCEHCGKTGLKGKQIHWANIDHKYRRNIKDWIRLCVKCHIGYDKKI